MRKQYSKEEITHILDRFMAGETSLAEEQLLADYFRTHEVNDEWQEYKEMFALFDSGKVDIEQATSADKADSSFINHHPSVIIRHSSLAIIGIAAAVILAFLLWPESHESTISQPEPHSVVAMHTAKQDTLVMQIEKAHTPMIAKETTLQTQTVTTKQTNQVQAHQKMEEATKVGRTDSFDYYLAQLEAEMDALDDSVSSAQLEKLISADARLRQLVNRIVGNEVEQALNATKPDSTTDYLNF